MGLTLCSDRKRENPKIEYVWSSSFIEEDNYTDEELHPQYPSEPILEEDNSRDEKLEPRTLFPSEPMKPPKVAKLNIEIVAGNTISASTSGGLLTSKYPESPGHGLRQRRSLRQKLTERKLIANCPQTPLGYYDEKERQVEKEAKLYIDALEDNTLTYAKNINSLSEELVNKGAMIAAELRREGVVIMNANRHILKTEHDINQNKNTLNGMTLRGKIANYRRRKPKQTEYPVDNEREKDYLPRSISLPAKFAYRSSPADTKQQQIKDTVKEMIFNMDTLREQCEGIAEEIMFQEPHLHQMSDNMHRVENEIVRQTTRIKEMY